MLWLAHPSSFRVQVDSVAYSQVVECDFTI